MLITALHGFLGRPHDWTEMFKSTPFANNIQALDLHCNQILEGMSAWARNFNAQQHRAAGGHGNILLGYSLGGRLALHSIIQRPGLWDAAVIISAHLGLENEEQIEQKRLEDHDWADCFDCSEWQALMERWEAREVFSSRPFLFQRKEEDYCRKSLSSCLRQWSLSNQANLRGQITTLDLPILWIAGESDIKYADQARSMHLKHTHSKIWIAPLAGHRVPWEASRQFISVFSQFLSQLT